MELDGVIKHSFIVLDASKVINVYHECPLKILDTIKF